MTSEVNIWNTDYMDSKGENDSLQTRLREVEDENQELRAQNLLQNRTIIELRNELVLLRIQMNELTDTSQLLRERVRNLTQNTQQRQQHENQTNSGLITAPPLMPPPPVPPPLPPPRIRISPRQVGAGEALTTPLGISVSSPPRNRVKRDCRQGFYRSVRSPYRRIEGTEPGPSTPCTQSPYYTPERPNYFVGLKIIPQFQSFMCSSDQSSGYNDSDSSGSDETTQTFSIPKSRIEESSTKKPIPLTRDFEIMKNVRNLHHQKVQQTILKNYNLSLPETNSKFFFPISWNGVNKENVTLPSTSGNEVRFFHGSESNNTDRVQAINRTASKVSDCVQYTFPTIHEGLHHSGVSSVVRSNGQPSRLRKLKKNIPYLFSENKTKECVQNQENEENEARSESNSLETRIDIDCEPSVEDPKCAMLPVRELCSDVEQDGFQGDESSNCMTSTDDSLEKICVSESSKNKKK